MFEKRLQKRLRRWQRSRAATTIGRFGSIRTLGNGPNEKTPSEQSPGAFTSLKNFPRERSLFVDAGSTHHIPIPDALSRGRIWNTPVGCCWIIERPLVDVFSGGDQEYERWRTRQSDEAEKPKDQDGVIRAFQANFPQHAIFLDLETCGLAGSAIFLAGLLHFVDDQIMLTQLWARNYAEEAALIFALGDVVRRNRVLVTFNGKSFDWPQVCDRTTRYVGQADTLPQLHHFDLLHHSRRKYQQRFGDCRLQTLETHVCGRRRTGDIPGRDIPGVYAEYVRTRDTKLVEPILHHNALDLITLWQLALRLS